MPRRDGDIRRSHGLRRGDCQQADRAGAEDGHAIAEPQVDKAQPVHADGQRLDQRAEAEVDLGREFVHGVRRHGHVLGEATRHVEPLRLP